MKEKITHHTIGKDGKSFYLCNQAFYSDFGKTADQSWKVTCKNCLRIVRGRNG